MHADDYDDFAQLLDDVYDLIGVGANKVISGGAKSMFFAAMAPYSLATVRAALGAHCVDRVRGRFTPKPADIIEQIEASTLNDGRPDGEEAWAIALTGQDEASTVVWTQEAAQAFAICQPVLASSGAISARKPFLAAYARLVAEARAARRPAQWVTSIGTDKHHQVDAIRAAVDRGLLPAPAVAGLLAGPANDPTPDQKARAQIRRVKRLMAVAAGRKEQRRQAEVEQKRAADDEWRATTNAAVALRLAEQARQGTNATDPLPRHRATKTNATGSDL